MDASSKTKNEDVEVIGKPIQIISIDLKNENMVLYEERLKSILDKVPKDHKVGIVSVVGAFRMGKSFLLDMMLHYLHYMADDEKEGWTSSKVDSKNDAEDSERSFLEGSANARKSSGFSWRSGAERQTTGIWMWNEVFVRTSRKTGKKVAMLLMDTQGMFDGEISQQLTTHIFGVSTLLSSYQIYNVSRQIQEDNMQHLALFSEYGKLAVGHTTSKKATSTKDDKDESAAPFQRLDFVIRDWQNFANDGDVDECVASMPKYLQSKLEETQDMAASLRGTRSQITSCFETVDCFLLPHPGFDVIKPNYDGDLRKVRSEFLGLARVYMSRIFSEDGVFAKKINERELTAPELMQFAVKYVSLFTKPARWQYETKPGSNVWKDLSPKDSDAVQVACAQQKSSLKLGAYDVTIDTATKASRKHAKTNAVEAMRLVHVFPKAQTLLEATAYVCNMNAKEAAHKSYKASMDKKCAPTRPYVGVKDLEHLHKTCFQEAIGVFKSIATVGSKQEIQKHQLALVVDIHALYGEIKASNANKDPYKNIEFYLIPGLFAIVAYVLRIVSDLSCYTPNTPEFDFEYADVCARASSYFWHVYMAVFFFCGIIFVSKGHAAARYFRMFYALASANTPPSTKKSEKSD